MLNDIDNVYIFVADALRWDYLPSSIEKKGHVFKSVASSTLSPTSFASIASGLHPPQHGVNTFAQQLSPDHNHLLENEAVETSFFQHSDNDPIYDVLGQDAAEKQRVDEMEPPFVNLERELLTHAPYGVSASGGEDSQEDAAEYIELHSRDLSEFHDEYRRGAERVAAVFEERLAALSERDLLDETLVIFTSDHGELLGEYASTSHTYPMVPKLVYVPTVVIAPDGSEPQREGIFSHVDVLATVVDALESDVPYETLGVSAFDVCGRERAYSNCRFPPKMAPFGGTESPLNRYGVAHNGLWDANGGWVFDDSSVPGKLTSIIKHTFPYTVRKWYLGGQNPRGYAALLAFCVRRKSRFGDPGFHAAEAREIIDDILATETTSEGDISELADDQLEHLENLGYR